MLTGRARKLLSKLYYNLDYPSSFTSADNLVKASGLDKRTVQQFLDEQATFGLHKHPRYKFARRKVRAPAIDECYHLDLLQCDKLKRFNDSYTFILVAVCVGSRMFFAIPVKSKSAPDMLKAIQELFASKNPSRVVTDRGKEFYNSSVQKYFKDRNINHFSTHSELKAVLAERAIRTIKTRLWKHFTHENTSRWVEALPKIIRNINHTVNRGIGQRPVDVTNADVKKRNQKDAALPRKKPKFDVGDCVRLSVARKTFKKGYEQTYTQEVFMVAAVKDRHFPAYYYIKALDGSPIEGSIYEQELVRATEDPDGLYRIEKILQKRKFRGKDQVLVKWLNYDSTSWIDAKEVVNLQ